MTTDRKSYGPEFDQFSAERDALEAATAQRDKIIAFLQREYTPYTTPVIAKGTGLDIETTRSHLVPLSNEGTINRFKMGRDWVWKIADRPLVPAFPSRDAQALADSKIERDIESRKAATHEAFTASGPTLDAIADKFRIPPRDDGMPDPDFRQRILGTLQLAIATDDSDAEPWPIERENRTIASYGEFCDGTTFTVYAYSWKRYPDRLALDVYFDDIITYQNCDELHAAAIIHDRMRKAFATLETAAAPA